MLSPKILGIDYSYPGRGGKYFHNNAQKHRWSIWKNPMYQNLILWTWFNWFAPFQWCQITRIMEHQRNLWIHSQIPLTHHDPNDHKSLTHFWIIQRNQGAFFNRVHCKTCQCCSFKHCSQILPNFSECFFLVMYTRNKRNASTAQPINSLITWSEFYIIALFSFVWKACKIGIR